LDSLDDLQGMKIRVNPTDPLIEAWSALGAQPTTFAWKEIYTGLQLGAIDGLLNEPEWIYRMRFHEVAPHIGLSEHDITVRLMTLSGKTLDRLSATLLFAFVGLIAYQILSRNLLALPVIYWSEELARFSFQWSIAIGTALGVLHADHFVLHAFRPGRLDSDTVNEARRLSHRICRGRHGRLVGDRDHHPAEHQHDRLGRAVTVQPGGGIHLRLSDLFL
jgi:hypothetical protein